MRFASAVRIVRALVLLVGLAGLVSTCGPAEAAVGPCAEEVRQGLTLQPTCEVAIGLARAQLGWQAVVIASTKVSRGAPCPPGARCAMVLGAWVVFTFWIGDPVMVFVHPTDGASFGADLPEPVAEWLL